ncbi:MAG: glutamate--tRNA ligase family protein [Bacteroidota bacterium]
MEIRTRIAPTPSGFLHLGNVFSFVLTWLYTKKNKGQLILRIDDLDALRTKQAYIDDLFATLEWLEIDYNKGPKNPTDFNDNYSQHLRIGLYQKALKELVKKQQIFACNCSRTQIKKASSDGQYPGTCITKNNNLQDKDTCWRLKDTKTKIHFVDDILGEVAIDLNTEMRNPVLRKKDGIAAYQIASLIDDLHFNINTIVRGIDLINSTAMQIHLANLLESPAFTQSTFLHHRLLTNAQNIKLSKTQQASPIHLWKNKVDGKVKLFREIAVLLNVNSREVFDIHDLLQLFNNQIMQRMA